MTPKATLRIADAVGMLLKQDLPGLFTAYDGSSIGTGEVPITVHLKNQRGLAYLLTAHSVAEENAIYPALAMCGLQADADHLYLDQAHAKVMNAMLDMAEDKLGDAWLQRVQELRSAVLTHARQDEEGNLYPRLVAAIDAPTATKLSVAYRREFLAVQPT